MTLIAIYFHISSCEAYTQRLYKIFHNCVTFFSRNFKLLFQTNLKNCNIVQDSRWVQANLFDDINYVYVQSKLNKKANMINLVRILIGSSLVAHKATNHIKYLFYIIPLMVLCLVFSQNFLKKERVSIWCFLCIFLDPITYPLLCLHWNLSNYKLYLFKYIFLLYVYVCICVYVYMYVCMYLYRKLGYAYCT